MNHKKRKNVLRKPKLSRSMTQLKSCDNTSHLSNESHVIHTERAVKSVTDDGKE